MWELIWPLLMVVISNTIYNICTKSTPNNVNAFGTLCITYLIATIVTFVIFVYVVKPENVVTELYKINWTAFALGLSIVGLELGYIFMYRAGWQVSSGSLVANISLACVLVIVGALLYKENIDIKQVLGIIVCMFGLILLNI